MIRLFRWHVSCSLLLGVILNTQVTAADGITGDPAKLVEAGQFRQALALVKGQPDATGPETRILLGRIDLGMGRYAEAEAKLSEPATPADEPVRLRALSELAEARGNLDQSLALMTQAVEARRKSLASTESLDGANALAEYRTTFGALAFRAGRIDTAKEQFQQAISLVSGAHAKMHALDVPHDERDPRLFAGGATAGLAQVYAALGDNARAERSWRGVMARTDDPEILLNLASYYLAKNDAKSAGRHLDRALRLSENKPADRSTRALILASKNQALDEALALAEAAYEDGPGVRATDTLAWILHRKGDDERARALLKPVLDQGSQDVVALYHAGVIAQSLSKPDEAKRLLTQCLKINPHFDPVAAQDARQRLEQTH